MKLNLVKRLALILGASLPLLAQSGEFRFPLGLAYGSGIYDAADEIFDMYEESGWDVDDRFIIPVGLTFNPYYEFDCGFGIGAGVGPTAFVVVNEETFSSSEGWDDESNVSFAIPIGLDLRYTFMRDKTFSPYIRGGFRYPIVGGDNIDDSKLGGFGAVGVEFFRTKSVGLGFEVGYDASEITVEGPGGQKEDVTFTGLTVSIMAVF